MNPVIVLVYSLMFSFVVAFFYHYYGPVAGTGAMAAGLHAAIILTRK